MSSQSNFYSTYKELKLKTDKASARVHYPIFTLPIRNWNILWTIVLKVRGENFYSTYKELKLVTIYHTCCPTTYFYSTYKELKPNPDDLIVDLFLGIFTLPIRNWNYFNTLPEVWAVSYFYSTYKELKLVSPSKATVQIVDFYSTYKELKPFPLVQISARTMDFYSTYKELKRWNRFLCLSRHFYFYSTYKELKL